MPRITPGSMLTVSVLEPSFRLLSISSAAVGVELWEETLSSSVMVLTASVLEPSFSVLSISSAVGVVVEKLDEMTRNLSWTEGSVKLSADLTFGVSKTGWRISHPLII